jgi:TorA maturation chaperone TorD
MNPEKNMIEELKAQLPVLNLLRQFFLKEPEKEFLKQLSQIPLEAAEEEGLEGLRLMRDSVRRNSHKLDEWVDQLSLEFARLFLGPVHAPAIPYASFYLSETRSLMTEETLEVRKRYLEAGLALKNLYSIPDDHIGIELEFIYYLTKEILQLNESNREKESLKLYQIRQDFLKDHMALWVPSFAQKVVDSTQEDFYKGGAFFLREMVEYQ